MKKVLIGCGVVLIVAFLCVLTSLGGLAVVGFLVGDEMTPTASAAEGAAPVATTPVIATLTPAPATPAAAQPTPTRVATYTPPANYTPAAPPLTDHVPYRAVVQILAETRFAGRLEPVWSGSGTIIDPRGFILTNAHVALSDDEERVDALQILLTEAEDKPPVPRYYAEVVRADEQLDIAILRIVTDLDGNPVNPEDLHLPYVRLGDSDKLHLGQPLTILGYPGIGGNTITLTRGEVSGFTAEEGYGDRAFIKTSATIAGGNSGGMVANNQGELVAIPTMLGSGDVSGDVVDCRYLADTNGDGVIDEDDACVPTGGFINALRPINLAKPMIEDVLGMPISSLESITPAPPAASPTPAGNGTRPHVIFEDDFSHAGKWPVGESESSETAFVNGEYRMLVKRENWIVWSDLNRSFTDIIISVDVKKVKGDDTEGDFGVICREMDSDHFYYFAITGDGHYQIFRAEAEDNVMDFIPLNSNKWTYSSWIHQKDGAVNHIRASCVGDTLTLAVNGHVLAVVQDSHYKKGDVGLIATTYATDYLDIRFDNFVLAEP